MKYNLKRVKVVMDVLIPVEDEDRLNEMDISEIAHECLNGDWSCLREDGPSVTLKNKKECQKACDEHGTELEFFFPIE